VGAEPPSPAPPRLLAPAPGVQAQAAAADAWLRRFQAVVVAGMAVVAGAVGAVAFFTSFEAIRSYAQHSRGITPAHAWAVPLLVDSFIVMATGADLWQSAARSRRWWEVCWPKLLLAGAAAVSFVLNVAHADTSAWSARGVAAIPPAALLLSVELLVMIVRRAALARTARLSAAAAMPGATVAGATGDRAAPPATRRRGMRSGDRGRQASGDQAPTTLLGTTSGERERGGATYRRVRELYLGGVTVAEIARQLGVSASYAQRTLRRVKADLALAGQASGHAVGRVTLAGDHDQQATRSRPGDQPAGTAKQAARAGDQATTSEVAPAAARPAAPADGQPPAQAMAALGRQGGGRP
jgi:transposase